MNSRLFDDRVQVKAVGTASGVSKCCQPLGGAVEESVGSNPISASHVGQGNTDLRQPLPQVAFLDRSRLPPRLEYLVR